MPDLYNAQFTRFEPVQEYCDMLPPGRKQITVGLTPVHYIREWQWPKNKGMVDSGAVYKTVRISEHRWPMRNTFPVRGPVADSVEWPEPPAPADRLDLIDEGLISRRGWLPEFVDSPALMLDDSARRVHARSPFRNEPNDGLPEDYLEFWFEETGDAGD